MTLLARHANDASGYESSGDSAFIPQLWSGKMVDKFYTNTIFGEIANTDYEGEIKDVGDSVVINTVPGITIRDYSFGDPTPAAGSLPGALLTEKPKSPKVLLEINKAKYFSFECNNIEEHQSKPDLMETFSNGAGEDMKVAVDASILSIIYTEALAAAGGDGGNTGTTAGPNENINLGGLGGLALTSATIIDYLVNVIGTLMDERDLPDTGRWIALPSKYCNMIKTSELKDASLAGDPTSILRNGKIGMIDRLTIYRSNQLTKVASAYQVIAGHRSSLTFASQMAKMEDLMNPFDFGKIVRGLNVYGTKVVKPDAFIHSQLAV